MTALPRVITLSRRTGATVAGVLMTGVVLTAVPAAAALTGGSAPGSPAGQAVAANGPHRHDPTRSGHPSRRPEPSRSPGGCQTTWHGDDWWAWGRILHGAMVVEGKQGTTSAVTVQRGQVTGSGPSTLTVASSDGFSMTWTVDGSTQIRSRGHRASSLADLTVGSMVGVVGGATTNGVTTATQIAVRCLAPAPTPTPTPTLTSTPTDTPTVTPTVTPSSGR